ncbi:TolC family protein [Methylotenera sp. L2L1]|uniref:TolC family protein n=1 Tax=Methylotenera sp. L2L1 TaxID=1502770 RepID=UPI00056D934D|nr:TolC family protein [Methylotenera sp. L2L1]
MQFPFIYFEYFKFEYFQKSIQHLLISFLLSMASITATSAAELVEPSARLSLHDALNLALKANPDIAVAMREQESVSGVKTQATLRPNPSVSTFMKDTRNATRETTLQINQEFELGNKRDARMAAAETLYNKAEVELENKKSEIHANVIAAFYGVLAAQERVSLAKTSLELANFALDAASKRVKAGKSSPVEETKSKIAESAAKVELNQAKTQLSASRKLLSGLWGSSTPVFEYADGDITAIPEVSALHELSAGLDNAPAVKLGKIEISMREAFTKVERSKSTPNITVSAGVVNNQELGLNQALLGLSIPIPIFDRNQGRLEEAISRTYKAEDELVALKNRMGVHLAGQYERLNAARGAAETLRAEILPGAESAFYAANKGFSAGKFDFLDVLDAQRTLVQAKSQYIQALLEAHQAVAEIERILGDVVTHHRKP